MRQSQFWTPIDKAAAFCDAFREKSRKCGLPRRLCDVGIPEDVLPMLARDAMKQTRSLPNNPRAMSEAGAHEIYRLAW